MFPAATKGGGMCLAFPDVCKTPAAPACIPIPYPDMQYRENLRKANAADAKAKAGSKKAQTEQQHAIQSLYKMTGKKAQSATQAVIIGKTVHMASMKSQNGANANMPAGMQVAPSQTNVVLVAP